MAGKLSQAVHARTDVKVVFEPPQELLDLLDGLAGRFGDLTPVMVDVSRLFEAPAVERLKTGGGGQWKPHADATVERWGSHPLLDLEPIGSGLIDSIDRSYGPDFAAAFSTAPHAHFPQFGTRQRGKEHNPVREIFDLTDEMVDEAVELIEAFLVGDDE